METLNIEEIDIYHQEMDYLTELKDTQQLRNFCFTLNNYTPEDVEEIKHCNKYKYIVFGFEIGKKGTPHLQGYVEWKNYIRFQTLKKMDTWKRMYVARRKGRADQAANYCKKDGDFYEFGEISQQGKRNDLEVVKDMIKGGSGMRDILEETNSYQALKYAQLAMVHLEPKRFWETEVTWITGKSGTGKTRLAWELAGTDAYVKSSSDKWFNGYDGHKNIILDDFRYTWMHLSDLLTILDRYPRELECKYGGRQIQARKIFITSIFTPEQTYCFAEEQMEQLLRRIHKIIILEDKDDWLMYAPTQENTQEEEGILSDVLFGENLLCNEEINWAEIE